MAIEDPLFLFRITRGVVFHHELPAILRATEERYDFTANPGWTARAHIRDRRRRKLAILTTENGQITLGNGQIDLDMTVGATMALTPSWAPWLALREWVYMDVLLIDPLDGQPHLFGDGRGIIRDRITT